MNRSDDKPILFCVVDFDKTLLTVDSMFFILRREKLYLEPFVLMWGVVWLGALILPREYQLFIRRHLKFHLLRILKKRADREIIERYAKIFAAYINKELVVFLQKNYTTVIVISSSWEPLISATLRQADLSRFAVYGTRFTEDFSHFWVCWYTNKLKVLDALKITDFDLFTDSTDDLPLMRRARNFFIV